MKTATQLKAAKSFITNVSKQAIADMKNIKSLVALVLKSPVVLFKKQ